MSERTPTKWVCVHCGSEHVVVGASAAWDKLRQDWDFELLDNSNEDWCHDCQHDVIDEVALTDLKDLAQLAILKAEEKPDGIPQ